MKIRKLLDHDELEEIFGTKTVDRVDMVDMPSGMGIKQTIAKWERITGLLGAANKEVSTTCGLCMEYGKSCEKCPVGIEIDQCTARGSTYETAARNIYNLYIDCSDILTQLNKIDEQPKQITLDEFDVE